VIASNAKAMLFAAIDQADARELTDREAVRNALYDICRNQRLGVTEALAEFIDILVEEYCPAKQPRRGWW